MKNTKELPRLKGIDFSAMQVEKCAKEAGLLRISIGLSKACNLSCPYCYADGGSEEKNELSFEEILDIINQAKEAGAKTVTLVGGEPLIHPKVREIISHINQKGLTTIIFTNGTVMDKELAKFLYNNNVSIIVKFNSFDDPEIQDELVGGRKGTFQKIKKTISLLIEAKFNTGSPTRLGIESIICHKNLLQIPKIFRFTRENNIYPYIELVTVSGRGKGFSDRLTKKETKEIFQKLLEIDQKEFGYTWIPRPPQVATTCKYYLTAAYITASGKMQPCPSVSMELGDLRKERLSEIMKKPLFKKIRNMNQNLKGPCKECKYHTECYGCRGTAFNLTGDIFSSDATCWVPEEKHLIL